MPPLFHQKFTWADGQLTVHSDRDLDVDKVVDSALFKAVNAAASAMGRARAQLLERALETIATALDVWDGEVGGKRSAAEALHGRVETRTTPTLDRTFIFVDGCLTACVRGEFDSDPLRYTATLDWYADAPLVKHGEGKREEEAERVTAEEG